METNSGDYAEPFNKKDVQKIRNRNKCNFGQPKS